MTSAMDLETQACEKLARSRAGLRQHMLARRAPQRSVARPADGHVGPFTAGLALLRQMPLTRIVTDTVGSWWTHHPLRLAASVAAEGVGAIARPLAQRHALLLVLGATLAGGLLVRSRPWRWIVKPALFAGLLPQLATRLVARLPPSSWVSVVDSLTQPRRADSPTWPAP